MTVLVRFTETNTLRGAEDARLAPLGTIRALLDWPLPPQDSEDTVLPDVIAQLSRALAACGHVAFRYDDVLPGAELCLPPSSRSLADRLLDVMGLGGDTFGSAIASQPALISALFAYGGWSYGLQQALVFDPAADPAPILAALGRGLDWRRRTLPKGARLLFGSGHDGCSAVVASENRDWLDRFRAALG